MHFIKFLFEEDEAVHDHMKEMFEQSALEEEHLCEYSTLLSNCPIDESTTAQSDLSDTVLVRNEDEHTLISQQDESQNVKKKKK